MDFKNITIILCRTSHPGNIGSTARAMQTMGFSNLSLVSPKIFPSPKASALASSATSILENAQVYENLKKALIDTNYVVGFTARKRELTQSHYNLRELPDQIKIIKKNQKVSLLFGNETNGLSNSEIKYCNALCYIDSEQSSSSLNLAQAVQICCYELKLALNTKQDNLIPLKKPKKFVANEKMNSFFEHLEITLDDLGFLKKFHGERLMQRLRLLFNRTQLDEDELNILRGILAEIQKKIK